MEKILLRVLGIIGVVIFVPLFLFTFADPQLIEKSGKTFVEWKLQSEVDQRVDLLELPKETKLENLLGAKVKELRAQTEHKLEQIRQQLKNDAPAIIAEQLAKLRNLDCECRKKWESSIKASMNLKLISLENAKSKLIDFSHKKYMEIVRNLTLDTRIFLGVNSLVFILLLLASFTKPKAAKHLFLPGGLMLLSTGVCSYFYLFEQNWFYTILYNDYTGFGYIVYLVLVFAILCDIVFNKARVTTEFLNACLQAIGQAGAFSPC